MLSFHDFMIDTGRELFDGYGKRGWKCASSQRLSAASLIGSTTYSHSFPQRDVHSDTNNAFIDTHTHIKIEILNGVN